MTITYRDHGGYIAVEVNPEYGIQFLDGMVYFTTAETDEDHRIPVTALMGITAE